MRSFVVGTLLSLLALVSWISVAHGRDTASWKVGEYASIPRSSILGVEVENTSWGWIEPYYPLEELAGRYQRLRIDVDGWRMVIQDWSVTRGEVRGRVVSLEKSNHPPSGKQGNAWTGEGASPQKPPRKPPPRKVTVTVAAGAHLGDQGEGLRPLGAPDPCDQPGVICVGGDYASDESVLVQFMLSIPVADRTEVRILWSGLADGPSNVLEEEGAMRFGVAASYRPTAAVRVGLGPAFHKTRITESSFDAAGIGRSYSRLGFVLDLGLSWPARSSLFLDASYQFWYGGSIDLGGDTDFSLNRRWVGFGLGIRL